MDLVLFFNLQNLIDYKIKQLLEKNRAAKKDSGHLLFFHCFYFMLNHKNLAINCNSCNSV